MSFSKDSALHTLLSMTPGVGTLATAAYGAKRDKDMDRLKQRQGEIKRRRFAQGRAETIGNAPAIERSRLLGSAAIGDY